MPTPMRVAVPPPGRRTLPVPVAAGRVFALGGLVPLDGRLSWAVRGPGFQPISCYLIRDPVRSLLIDTGVPLHRDLILQQLGEVLPPGSPLTVLLTRTEMDCVLNLPAMDERYDVDAVHLTGGIHVPFRDGRARTVRHAVGPGERGNLQVGATIELELLSPRLRLLPLLWPYDPRSGTLFTSDLFLHSHAPADGPYWLDDSDPVDDHHVRATVAAKMGWIAGADTAAMADDLAALLSSRPVAAIAPTHGRVILGMANVRRHAAALERTVRAMGRSS